MPAGFGDLDNGCQPCQPAANYDDFRCRCHKFFNHKGQEGSRRNVSALLHFVTVKIARNVETDSSLPLCSFVFLVLCGSIPNVCFAPRSAALEVQPECS